MHTHTHPVQQPARICEKAASNQFDFFWIREGRLMDMGKTANVIYVDFSKAFWSVSLWLIHNSGYPVVYPEAIETQSGLDSRTG